MDIAEIFENLGLGLGIVIGIIALLFVFLIFSAIIPGLLFHFGGLLFILIIIIAIITVIYFIGKFVKDFIK